jgi:triacylglycerol lipase
MQRPHTIIIDGLWARPSRWNPLRDLLEQHIGSAEIWEYDSSGAVPFEDLGEQLARRIRDHDGAVNLVAYSMGGLVARAAHLIDPKLPLRRAAFLNSPHQGSFLAYLLPLKGVRQMRPGSPFMKQLHSSPWPTPTFIVWNPLDTMVVPGTSTRLKNATETVCCQVPIHLWPIWSGKLRNRIVSFLKAGEN